MPDGKAALLQGRGSQGGSAAVGQRQRRGAVGARPRGAGRRAASRAVAQCRCRCGPRARVRCACVVRPRVRRLGGSAARGHRGARLAVSASVVGMRLGSTGAA